MEDVEDLRREIQAVMADVAGLREWRAAEQVRQAQMSLRQEKMDAKIDEMRRTFDAKMDELLIETRRFNAMLQGATAAKWIMGTLASIVLGIMLFWEKLVGLFMR